MTVKATKSVFQIFRDNICTMFNLLNLLIAVSLAMVGAWKNILFITVIIINTAVGIFQEIKAKRQIERLTIMSQPRVRVERGGSHIIIRSDDVVCGDTLCLESGSVVCCDCEILDGTVEVNESVLTGESEPVVKRCGDKLLSGSSIISGKCRAEVMSVGDDSFAAKMVTVVKGMVQSGSEMLAAMKKVTKFTGFFIVPLGILLFVQGHFFRGEPLAETVVATSDDVFECTASLPFSSERKYSCVTLSDGRTLVIGAPEKFGTKVDPEVARLMDVISEGRRVINNLTKSAGVFFIKTIYSVLLCIFCLLTNSAFPFIPIQITLIDAVIEAFPNGVWFCGCGDDVSRTFAAAAD